MWMVSVVRLHGFCIHTVKHTHTHPHSHRVVKGVLKAVNSVSIWYSHTFTHTHAHTYTNTKYHNCITIDHFNRCGGRVRWEGVQFRVFVGGCR